MLLDDGIATIYASEDVSGAGDAPKYARIERTQSYYAELGYETKPEDPTGRRTEQRIDARIRIQQCRAIREDDVAQLGSFHDGKESGLLYKIVRAYHGVDEENGMPISDLSLMEVSKR